MDTFYQAAIIGGGPAGLATGICLAQNGLRVLLVERRNYPVDKCCGEGVLPTGLQQLAAMGVSEYLQEGEYYPFRGVRYFSPSGIWVSGYFREGEGWGIPRLNLSSSMRRRAEQVEGLTICEGREVRGYRRVGERMCLDIDGRLVAARLLIGADGINSRLRRWAGLEVSKGGMRRWGARQHYLSSPWSDFVEVYWGRGIEAYVTPSGPDLVSVAFLWDRNRYQPKRAGRALCASLLDHFPLLQERLGRAQPCGPALTLGHLRRDARSPIAAGVALVGDAAGYLDPITGEGISLALAQARALARIVTPLLKDPGGGDGYLRAEELQPYAWAHRSICRPNRFTTTLALALSRSSLAFETALRVLKRSPRLFQALLSLNMGGAEII